ncbi:MAG TPA: phosphomannomutase/phosphoglucomutase [Solirubrobacterales bacterium]|nr:phosphomannomutase/phosphoglucomutase [Solirubrobacterales bacterium]
MSSIFKAYDIRGIYGEEMDEATAEQIGRGFAQVLARLRGKSSPELRVGLGRDMRLSAPSMADAVAAGLIAEGVEVLDAGMVPTELLYHLVGARELDGGAMVTASHNPKAYTGIKLVREGALALSGEAGIDEIRAVIEGGLGPASSGAASGAAGGGSRHPVEIGAEFRERALSFIEPGAVRPLRVVVDGGNGMAGPTVGPILRELGVELIELYFEPDGNFPDHEPNPLLEENRRLIMERVRAEGADLGIAWDGDADRCFFIDDAGEFCDGDFICTLLARAMLEREPGATVLYDPRSSRAVPDTIAAAGGSAKLSRVGHAYFKTRMREESAVFGGEVSGHYYFRDFWCADSGTIPALLLLELISREGRPLSELIGELRGRYFISGEINSEVEDPTGRMEQLVEMHPDATVTRLDGVSIDYPDWHFNVRPSNTEPLLRLNLESLISREDMERRRDQVLAVIRGG